MDKAISVAPEETKRKLKKVHTLMKNEIKSIDKTISDIKKALPKSGHTIDRVVEPDKVLPLASIIAKLSYMTVEDLEQFDDEIKVIEG